MKRFVLAVVLIAAFFLSVGFHFAQDAEPVYSVRAATPNLAGIWVGVYSSNEVGQTAVTLVFQQLGSNITGTYLSANGAQGVMTGGVDKAGDINLRAVQTTPTCHGSFSMPVQVDGNSMAWSFQGNDCLGVENGRGKATRQ